MRRGSFRLLVNERGGGDNPTDTDRQYLPVKHKASQFWSGKCVIITGASSGIGWALAEHLAAHGARLGLLARSTKRLAALHERIERAGGCAAWTTADVTDLERTQAATRELQAAIGPCEVLVAGAGIYRQTHGRRFDPSVANEVLATNVQGVVNAFGAVLPGMLERKHGHLAVISSIAGFVGLPAGAAYSAGKAALMIFMQSLRLDLRETGVKVTTICPGYVDTPMITDEERASLKGLVTAEDAARRIARAIERGRAECWFPWRTWLPARLASLLPAAAYQRIIALLPEMEESPAQTDEDTERTTGGSSGQLQPHDADRDQGDAPETKRIG